jgi:hypothetical protein
VSAHGRIGIGGPLRWRDFGEIGVFRTKLQWDSTFVRRTAIFIGPRPLRHRLGR